MNELKRLLSSATYEERRGLAQILESENSSTDALIDYLSWNCQSVFGYYLSSTPSYKDIVRQVADQLSVSYKKYESVSQLEIKIAKKVMETVWENMTPEQRREMEEELRKTAEQFDKTGSLVGSASVIGALGAAQLSGFGVYLLASTALGSLTGVLGITLPFAVYTTMSSAIAVVIGPVGWIGAGLFALWKLTGANYKKLVPAVLYICMLRSKC